MLTFKQFLSEAPLIDDFAAYDKPGHRAETDTLLGDRMFAIQRTERESGKKHKPFKHLGPYTLYHAPPSGSWGDHSVLVKLGKQVVGHVGFKVRKDTTLGGMQISRHLDATELPRFLRAHSGNRAKIPHLASQVYMATAKHFGMPVLSGSQQTPGGQSVWHGIAKLTGNVTAVNIDTRKQIPNYDPSKHDREVYDPENGRGANWTFVHTPQKRR